MRLGNGWREWSASVRSCARKTAALRTTFRDGRYGPLQPTAVAETNDGLGERVATYRFEFGQLVGQCPCGKRRKIRHCPKRLIWMTGSNAVWDLHRRLRRCPLSSQSST